MTNDRKLALTIAAALLIAFAAIAALSILSGSPEPEASAVAARAHEVPPAVQPASVTPVPTTTAAPAPVSAGTPEEAADFVLEPGVNYLARGIEAYQARNFDHAVAYLMAESDVHPDRPYTQYLLGLALWKAGRTDEAAETMRQAATLDDTSVKTLVNLSRIENDRGAFDAALEAAQNARMIDGADPTAMFLVGRSLFNLGRLDEAADVLRQSVGLDPGNGYAWNMLGLTLLASDEDPGALEALENAVELEPRVAYIQNNVGMALERNGFRDEAVAAYRLAAEIDGGVGKAAANLARLDPEGRVPEDVDAGEVTAVLVEPAAEPAAAPATGDDGK